MARVKDILRRVSNGFRKVGAGLTLFGESVWPGVQNDLFVAHTSIYHFFGDFVPRKHVLDAGCGTGYGSKYLVENGALTVLGVDVDRRSISYARRHFSRRGLEFEVMNCERLDLPDRSFNVVVSSNVLEHLENPAAFLTAVRTCFAAEGQMVIALPPILGSEDKKQHDGIHYHRSNFTVDQWTALFSDSGWSVKPFRHDYVGSKTVDFSSPRPSILNRQDFVFNESGVADMYRAAPITAIYVLSSR